MKKKIVVFSGAGISAESGVKTFRDHDGLWENHRIEDVASPEGFRKNPQLVLDFYNARRRQLNEVEPNDAHLILAELQEFYDVEIITQNVDDLHERAGSKKVLHLHGELKKARPIDSDVDIVVWENDLNVGDKNDKGVQLRPHIVWFGETVSEMENAIEITSTADYFIVIGTSMTVYPAAGLIHYLPDDCEIFVIDPKLSNSYTKSEHYFQMSATEGMKILTKKFLNNMK
ncbi:SIR2 family NAD-dependent protein deacylase [Kaistella carnis]|uniref:NAD-dependent protein deacylase n=1 Tax=Kaistella carnis TaxID=1241979 RepID=A0A3G8XPH0_9FLAO|nr:Sir2 family NAD-dependent protein deacetylase [Kaistella carnis]AZI32144.1 NAD-dependent deacylase [Kaistella carnis]